VVPRSGRISERPEHRDSAAMRAIHNTEATVIPVLRRIADSYPPAIAAVQRYIDVPRTAFNLSLLFTLPHGARVGDIGGGLSLFSPSCSALGFDVTLVDDFGGAWQNTVAESVFDRVHRAFGVKIIRRDIVSEGVEFEPESFDAFTIFDTIEHWHNSPKRVFHQLMAALKPGGLLIISSPNCVNLRKRITVPFGVGKWTLMQDWYEVQQFRSHVREPDVADLRYIAADLGLRNAKVIGRNWSGYRSRFHAARLVTPLIDRMLQCRPSLCSDIYLVGRKS
jgi:2-polyprenyl-3-methyl-5-hydroxy-6-metoxy-1,4-benzoquinol methylase